MSRKAWLRDLPCLFYMEMLYFLFTERWSRYMNKYDVIIIGAGPSGIFCAYELMRQKPDMKVLMIEKGRSIEKRQ